MTDDWRERERRLAAHAMVMKGRLPVLLMVTTAILNRTLRFVVGDFWFLTWIYVLLAWMLFLYVRLGVTLVKQGGRMDRRGK